MGHIWGNLELKKKSRQSCKVKEELRQQVQEETKQLSQCRGSCRSNPFGTEPWAEEEEIGVEEELCRGACRDKRFGTDTPEEEEKRWRNEACRGAYLGGDLGTEAIPRPAEVRDGARAN